MKRRTVLLGTSIGATIALGGCVSDDDGEGDDDGGGSGADDDSAIYEATAGEVPEERPLKHELELLHPELRDPERPLVVEISVTNRSDESIAYADRRDAIGLFRTAGAFLLMSEDHEGYEFADDWWSATDRFAQTEDYQTEEVPPGETNSAQLAVVVADPEENPTEPPEQVQFTLPFRVGTPEAVVGTEQQEWTFTLTRTEQ